MIESSTDELHDEKRQGRESKRFFRKTALIMLAASTFSAMFVTVLHWLEPDAHPIDRFVPPAMALVFLGLLVVLLLRPKWVLGIVMLALATMIAALTMVSWFFVIRAYLDPGVQLVESLPPVNSILLAVSVLIMIFLQARLAFLTAVCAWCVVAVPVLVYLFSHPAELWSPRGQDMILAYGPTILLVVVLIPFQRGLRETVEQLHAERAFAQSLAELDPLTKLYNRRAGKRILDQVLADKERTGVVLFDVDHFKSINDTHGHPTGDAVLRELAKRCSTAIRKGDSVSRWGGEEFLVVLRDVDARVMEHVAEMLCLVINTEPFEPVGTVTASFGATLVQASDTPTSLLERVDRALYQAKSSGRNCVVLG